MYETVSLDDERNALAIIDQTLLPAREELIFLTELEDIRDAIYHLKVRGAPAIGVAAAIGIYLEARAILNRMRASRQPSTFDAFMTQFRAAKERLNSARPKTAKLRPKMPLRNITRATRYGLLFWKFNRTNRRLLSPSKTTRRKYSRKSCPVICRQMSLMILPIPLETF
ncbi:MAG: hypothetical protein FWH01_12550 [Oscillospiraceae bacterium]|nr:hypothetical protein [Oscillospiraceae bacterium]